ncbi:hypothetical protein D9615_009773 [Tricholomella constricta]|uniref:DUF6729 domain-containing protein n=1 Tax=Tricholomella constricta TaxID=117010 RepID=A0A8H5GSJ6_9AGAR|nr:hypothetical protein D9615_009773 [Tricholomella constricta]
MDQSFVKLPPSVMGNDIYNEALEDLQFTLDDLQQLDELKKRYFSNSATQSSLMTAATNDEAAESFSIARSTDESVTPINGDTEVTSSTPVFILTGPEEMHEELSQLPKKCGPGHPTKDRAPTFAEDKAPKVKQPVGRPRGSGPRQIEAAQGQKAPAKKKPIGRPRKYVAFGSPSQTSRKYSIRGLRVPGIYATGPSHRSMSSSGASSSSPSESSVIIVWLLLVHLCLYQAAPGLNKPMNLSRWRNQDTRPFLRPHVDPSDLLFEDDDTNNITGGEDVESDLLEDGAGEDDDGDEDKDANSEPRAQSSKVPLHPLAPWILKDFNKYVKESQNRGPDGLPPLYCDHQTFWFPQQATFFILKDDDISPQKFYDRRFFLWDPLALLVNGIQCPNEGCTARLWRHSHIRRPRRVVDLNGSFRMVGYRYQCPECCPPKPVIFQSWDPRIIARLPPDLAAEFPARLTYRSGISTDVLSLMRSCFQHGMGSKQFSNVIRVQHLQNYDRLHLRYLQNIASRYLLLTGQFMRKFKSFPPFDDRSPDGFQGFVPTWEDEDLTPEQIQYAALDVHASLSVYDALTKLSSPQPLPSNPEIGTPVILFNTDRSAILARGHISPYMKNGSFDGIDITPSRAMIVVQEVLVPGALILNGTRHPSNRKPLEYHGLPPFQLLCLRSHLFQSPPSNHSIPSPQDSELPHRSSIDPARDIATITLAESDDLGISDSQCTSIGQVPGVGDLLCEVLSPSPHASSPERVAIGGYFPDPASQAEGRKALDDIVNSDWVMHIRSRVLKDPFHVFNQFYISASHGLLREFAIALRDAIFIPDMTDKARIITWGRAQKPPQSWDDILFRRARWLFLLGEHPFAPSYAHRPPLDTCDRSCPIAIPTLML